MLMKAWSLVWHDTRADGESTFPNGPPVLAQATRADGKSFTPTSPVTSSSVPPRAHRWETGHARSAQPNSTRCGVPQARTAARNAPTTDTRIPVVTPNATRGVPCPPPNHCNRTSRRRLSCCHPDRAPPLATPVHCKARLRIVLQSFRVRRGDYGDRWVRRAAAARKGKSRTSKTKPACTKVLARSHRSTARRSSAWQAKPSRRIGRHAALIEDI